MAGIRRGTVGGALALVLVVLAALQASTASATYPGANGRIAFTYHDREGSSSPMDGIWTVHPNGSHLTRLTKGYAPAWSADGRLIAFNRNGEGGAAWIFAMRADGTHQRKITRGLGPSFSPDRRNLLFSDRSGIAKIRADGTHYQLVAPGAAQGEYSPDGERIVYRNNDPRGIWMMRSDGSGRHPLVPNRSAFGPHWRPDGRRIIFNKCVDPRCYDAQIRIVNPDGSNGHVFSCGRRSGVYSPDGAFVAYYSEFGPFPNFTGSNIWIARRAPECANAHPITHYAKQYHGFAYDPAWQPLPTG